jgi:hypothetical protein
MKIELSTEYRVISEQLYPKYRSTPGVATGELALMITLAREMLPYKFKVALRELSYFSYNDSNSETIFVRVVFIDEKLLKDL